MESGENDGVCLFSWDLVPQSEREHFFSFLLVLWLAFQ